MISFTKWLEKKQLNESEESEELVFFFKKDDHLYGTSESGRLTFARMKNPEKEDEQWSKEASFSAYDLESEKPSKSLFSYKDLKNIEVIEQETAEKELKKKGKKMPDFSDSNDSVEES